jgi:hypothetical protein
MLKHPDPEVQFLVEVLEGQRDQAVAQAAAFFRQNQELTQRIKELETQQQKAVDEQCGGNTGN